MPTIQAVRRWPVHVLAATAGVWVLVLLAAPLAVVAGEESARWLAAALYEAAGRICHQRLDRSWTWHGVPYPVCGRCLALYLSGAVGATVAAAAAWRVSPALQWPVRPPLGRSVPLTPEAGWLAVFAAPPLILLVVEWLGADPGTWARATVTAPLGALVGWICGRALARQR